MPIRTGARGLELDEGCPTFRRRFLQSLGDHLRQEGVEVGVEKGDVTAIIHIFDRLESKPMQRAEVKGEGYVVHEYRSLEDVRVFLLERPRRHTRARAVCQPSCPG